MVHIQLSNYEKRSKGNSRSLALKPSGGEPTGQVSNSQVSLSTVGVAVIELVPDSFSAGAESTT